MESDVDLLSNIAIIQTNTFLTEAFPRHRVACLFSHGTNPLMQHL